MTLTPITPGNRPAPLDNATLRQTPGSPQAAGKPPRPTPPSDSVTLSATPSAVRDLATAPPVNETKVAGLKAAIAAGTYVLDPQAVADKMIALDLP